jgi:hypothetical protein
VTRSVEERKVPFRMSDARSVLAELDGLARCGEPETDEVKAMQKAVRHFRRALDEAAKITPMRAALRSAQTVLHGLLHTEDKDSARDKGFTSASAAVDKALDL